MTTTIFSGQSPAIENPEDLLLYFRSSEKPSKDWRVGTEHEKLGFDLATMQPLPYAGERGIHRMLELFVEKFGWAPVVEDESIIALLRGQASITLEPGGQLELSGAPLVTVHETCTELHQHLEETTSISKELGIGWLGLGRNPVIPSKEMPWMPKKRYGIMRGYLPTRGKLALDMMAGTATVQTNLDYASEEDMSRKFFVGMSFSPLMTALFANSPFAEGRPSGYLSTRTHVWQYTDPDRCGVPPSALREGFGYQDYINYALDVPMFFIHREGHYLPYPGRSFRTFVEKGMDGHVATHEDWLLHLTTLFPEVRLKNVLEFRMVDVGPPPFICALAALSRGLFYDETALRDAEELARKLPVETHQAKREELLRHGLKSDIGGRSAQSWAMDLVNIAEAGLERLNQLDEQGENEVKFLAPLRQIATSGTTQAEALLETWAKDWNKTFPPLMDSTWRMA